jgi:hypothetical protein
MIRIRLAVWETDSPRRAATAQSRSTTYAIDPFEPAGGTKAIRVLKTPGAPPGQRTWYYVELRRIIGFDSFMGSNANVMNGILVHTGSEANGNSSYLLDMTPETNSRYDPAHRHRRRSRSRRPPTRPSPRVGHPRRRPAWSPRLPRHRL